MTENTVLNSHNTGEMWTNLAHLSYQLQSFKWIELKSSPQTGHWQANICKTGEMGVCREVSDSVFKVGSGQNRLLQQLGLQMWAGGWLYTERRMRCRPGGGGPLRQSERVRVARAVFPKRSLLILDSGATTCVLLLTKNSTSCGYSSVHGLVDCSCLFTFQSLFG